MMMNRRSFIAATGATGAAVLTGYSTLIEPDMVEFTYHTINERSGHKMKFAHITDLHLKSISRQHENIGLQLSNEDLDFIIITGDSIDANSQFQTLNDFMSVLPSRIPKFAVLGNWEHWGNVSIPDLGDIYARWNCDLLVNRSVEFVRDDTSILLTGLDDFIGGVPSPIFALKEVKPRKEHLLLAHCPQYLDRLIYLKNAPPLQLEMHQEVDLNRYSFSNIFSGHTHGGQINIGGFTPFVPAGSGGYIKGWFHKDHHHLYVSRGLGTSILPLRIGSVPEVAIFDYYLSTPV